MGKSTLIIVVGVFLGVVTLVNQSRETALETTRIQASYEHEVLAREIARSASALALSKAQQAGGDLDEAIGYVNGTVKNGIPNYEGSLTGEQQGGSFDSQASLIDGQNVRIVTTGYFGDAEHTIEDTYTVALLTVEDTSMMQVDFQQSMAGYCSAVFLQRLLPKGNNGHGNNADGVDSSNPGSADKVDSDPSVDDEINTPNGFGAWIAQEPEMIFDSGHNRTGSDATTAPPDIVLIPGTRLNFFIAVDRDCSEEGIWVADFDSGLYDWLHHALQKPANMADGFEEGRYAMIEEHNENNQRWRIAFEDLEDFSPAQHDDIKAHGYGGTWDPQEKTYGGTGWQIGNDYYRKLEDFNWKPDFSDQVIEVTLNPCGDGCGLLDTVEEVVEDVVEVVPDL